MPIWPNKFLWHSTLLAHHGILKHFVKDFNHRQNNFFFIPHYFFLSFTDQGRKWKIPVLHQPNYQIGPLPSGAMYKQNSSRADQNVRLRERRGTNPGSNLQDRKTPLLRSGHHYIISELNFLREKIARKILGVENSMMENSGLFRKHLFTVQSFTTRPVEIIWWFWFQIPFSFLAQKESTYQILGDSEAIKVCHQATEVLYFHTMEIRLQG